MREDYLAQLDPFVCIFRDRLRAHFRLVRLSKEAALSAITSPVTENTDRRYANHVADHLVEDLSKMQVETNELGRTEKIRGAFIEPILLQVVCRKLWEKLPASVKEITKENLVNVDQALADFYQDAIKSAVEGRGVKEDRLRKWCESLITINGTRGMVHRDPDSTHGIPNTVIDRLVKAHLIRTQQRAGGIWYELAHDRLIKPIKDSNSEWKKTRHLKIMIPIIVASVAIVSIAAIFAFNSLGTGAGNNPGDTLGQSPAGVRSG